MGVLTRRQHEAFAQLVASGSTIVDAYEKAGYPRNRSNACRLRLREHICVRIDELVAQRTAHAEREALTAAEKAGVDAFWVIRSLRRNATLSARRGDTAASNRAVELIGRHIGMFTDRKEIQINMVDDADQYLQQLLELVAKPEPLQLEHSDKDGRKYGSASEHEPDITDIVEEIS